MLEALARIPSSLKLVAAVQAANAQITAAFGQQASKAIGDYAQKQMQEAARLQAAAQTESDPQHRTQLQAQAQQLSDAWGNNGTLRLLAHTVVGGLTGGASGAAAGGASGAAAAGSEVANNYLSPKQWAN